MLYGSDPTLGFVRGNVYAHPALGVRFEAPPGFRLINGRHRLVAKGGGGGLFLFDLARRPRPGDLFDYIAEEWAPSLDLADLERLEVNGFPAATGTSRVETNIGELDLRLVAIRTAPDRIFRFMFLGPPEEAARLSQTYRRTASSFRRLTAEEKAMLAPTRITIREVAPGDTVERLAAETPFARFRELHFRVLNGLGPNEPLRPGRLGKVVRDSDVRPPSARARPAFRSRRRSRPPPPVWGLTLRGDMVIFLLLLWRRGASAPVYRCLTSK